MRDDLSGLTALLIVAEKRSFTAAAAALRVTPSAVSQSVRALEERLGVRLLQRTTRSVGLTEAGERFVSRLKPALDDVQAAFESLNELRDRPAGLLRLTVPRVVYEQVVDPIVPAFLAAYPEIRLDVSINDAFVNIVEEGFDVGIRLGEMLDREMVAMKIGGDQRMAVVGSHAYFAVRGKPKHPRELLTHDCINYRSISRGAVYRWEFTVNGEDIDIGVEGRFVANDVRAMVNAALEGVGLAYVFESVVREHLDAKRLVRVLDGFCPPFPGFFLYYPSRSNLSPKVQAFASFMKPRVQKKPK
ncbi:Transcriptional regulator, LysR family [Labilithrix luteola]|uniref:Transcriptional regulator, LysR family n=1 Tax=Labilithrix luteola TaxID=1391654 RepID=A0A0K1PT37_9BACT|nr:LysR family transcriptional regulator [Labilithrix luteola]AKU96279.1 Transcriptional regulator, LysR family [Labilithrix luteola]